MNLLKQAFLSSMHNDLTSEGFQPYKNRLWKYDPLFGYVITFDLVLTRWGTLKDILLGVSSYQSPIRLTEYTKKPELLITTWVEICAFQKKREGISIYTMGHPNQSVELTLEQQFETLTPFIKREIYPLISNNNHPKQFLKHYEIIQQISTELGYRVSGLHGLDIALEWFKQGELLTALQKMELHHLFCHEMIEKYKQKPMNIPQNTRFEIIQKWEKNKKHALEIANFMKTRPEKIQEIIIENQKISEQSCKTFFSKKFISNSLKTVQKI